MRIAFSLAALAAFVGCAGTTNEFSTQAAGPVAMGVDCVAEEITEEGWQLISRDDAGLLRAEAGRDWIEAQVVPGEGPGGSPRHEVRLSTSDSPAAREVAEEVVTECQAQVG